MDEIIFKLLQAKNYKPNQEVDLSEAEIRWLILKAKSIFMDQPVFIELDSPINICGDTHGQFYDLLRLFNYGGEPPKGNYLFLGDYVDRGKNSIETISLLFAYKIKYMVFLMNVKEDIVLNYGNYFQIVLTHYQ